MNVVERSSHPEFTLDPRISSIESKGRFAGNVTTYIANPMRFPPRTLSEDEYLRLHESGLAADHVPSKLVPTEPGRNCVSSGNSRAF
ncbi:hypothetical protein GEMRC1_011633 [Eukaryota sp. GEM-RC1]